MISLFPAVKVIVSAQTMQAIADRVAATIELKAGRELDDGRWEIELQQITVARLKRRFPGLSIDDAILALCGVKS